MPTPVPDTTTPSAPAPSTTPAPTSMPAPAVTPIPVVVDQGTAEAKLAVVLRSYTLLQEENDKLKADQEKFSEEKSSLEAQFTSAKDAIPLANQAAGLREQLRQTQDQLAALSLENNALKTRLVTGAPAPGTGNLTPVNVPTTLAPAPTPAAPADRIHIVVAGETLGKISQQYYGTPSRWREILAANPGVLKNEKSVYVGAKLRIP
ncbi:MAG: LysM peptidoglycan-binding domain-containing protein [Opitutaceae bacterium]